jgi:hypothetical protein
MMEDVGRSIRFDIYWRAKDFSRNMERVSIMLEGNVRRIYPMLFGGRFRYAGDLVSALEHELQKDFQNGIL